MKSDLTFEGKGCDDNAFTQIVKGVINLCTFGLLSFDDKQQYREELNAILKAHKKETDEQHKKELEDKLAAQKAQMEEKHNNEMKALETRLENQLKEEREKQDQRHQNAILAI